MIEFFRAAGFARQRQQKSREELFWRKCASWCLEERRRNPPAEPKKKIPKPRYIKRGPLPPERRAENARMAAHARAKALSPERRLEIARQGGEAAKAKLKGRKKPPRDSF